MVDDAPPYESQQDTLTGSFTEHQKWVKPQHTKAIPFCKHACNPWFMTSDPLELLARDVPAPALYKDIRTYDVACAEWSVSRKLCAQAQLLAGRR